MRYVDLMGGQKPHLLIRIVNNLGAERTIGYAASTRFYLADKLAGRPWITRLPFPVHVAERIETIDRISGNRFVSRFAYHHGYFDGVEREFRGFGLVEQWDTEELASLAAPAVIAPNLDESSHVPPVLTRSWFHTGVYFGRDRVSSFFSGLADERDTGEYYREPGASDDDARALLLEDTILPDGLTPDEEREACRALKGAMLRQEVYALDGTDGAAHPYTVTEQNLTIRTVQPRAGNRHAVFLTHSREAVTSQYERNPADPRTSHAFTLETDAFGNVLKAASIGYGRRTPDLALAAEDRARQTALHATCSESGFTNAIDDADAYRTPSASDARSYELTGLALVTGRRRFDFAEVLGAVSTATAIPFEASADGGGFQKRLTDHVRTLYRPDDMGASRGDVLALLPLGRIEPLALAGETYRLAFTPELLALRFGDRVTTSMLEAEGRYVHAAGDPGWWMPSGRVFLSPDPADEPAAERAHARAHFFLTHRTRDPFHGPGFETESVVSLDAHDLFVTSTRDALGNVAAAEHDYRTLQPRQLTDANGNRSQVAFDATGQVVGTAVMGKSDEEAGDSLDGFVADLDEPAILAALRRSERACARAPRLGDVQARLRSVRLPAHAHEPVPAAGRGVHARARDSRRRCRRRRPDPGADRRVVLGWARPRDPEQATGRAWSAGPRRADRHSAVDRHRLDDVQQQGAAGQAVRAVLLGDSRLRAGARDRHQSGAVLRPARPAPWRRSTPTTSGPRSCSTHGIRRRGMSATRS